MDKKPGKLEEICQQVLEELGEETAREGLLRTPFRYSKALRELTSGYRKDLDTIVNNAIFHEEYSEMVVVKDIEFYSLCEHHVLPFFGRAHVAYVPDGKIIGLSKIPRIVDMFARRLQVQERLTEEITNAINELLQPKGVACMISAQHLCMMMRGVQAQSSSMVTSSMRGVFLKYSATRDEFLSIIRGGDSRAR